jgi:hypothetical protein
MLSGEKKTFHHLGETGIDLKQTSKRKVVDQKAQIYFPGLPCGQKRLVTAHIPAPHGTS